MSQAGIVNMAGGGGSGTPIQTLTGDSGGAVPPTANNINVTGATSTSNNSNGVTTVGTIATSNLAITLTNRITGSVTTSDGTTATTLLSFPLGAVAGTYNFNIQVVGYNVTDSLGAGYTIDYIVRTNGAAATSFGIPDIFFNEETTMSGVNVAFSVTIIANTFTVRVTGLAGKTIDWLGLAQYIFVS